MEITQEQKLYAQVVQKAWDDAQFKSDLMTNPVAAIENFTGTKVNLPEGKVLVVQDQTDASKVYFNIPAKVDLSTLELTDEQLEMVAGGEIVGTASLGLAVIGLFAAGVGIGLAIK